MIDLYLVLALSFLVVFGLPIASPLCRGRLCDLFQRLAAAFSPNDRLD